jgi:hypothetical protein
VRAQVAQGLPISRRFRAREAVAPSQRRRDAGALRERYASFVGAGDPGPKSGAALYRTTIWPRISPAGFFTVRTFTYMRLWRARPTSYGEK